MIGWIPWINCNSVVIMRGRIHLFESGIMSFLSEEEE